MHFSVEFHYKALKLYLKLATPAICERNSKTYKAVLEVEYLKGPKRVAPQVSSITLTIFF
jgi:hypothetical protein